MINQRPTHFEKMTRHRSSFVKDMRAMTWQEPFVRKHLDKVRPDDYKSFVFDGLFPVLNDLEVRGAPKNVQDTSLYVSMLSAHLGSTPKTWVASHIVMEYMTYMFHREGCQVFSVMSTLADLLMDTDLDVDTELLQLPYRAFYVEVPKGMFVVYNDLTGHHPVEGLYVCEDPYLDLSGSQMWKDPGIEILLESSGKIPTRTIRIMIIGSSTTAGNDSDDALFHFRIDVGSGMLNDYIEYAAQMVERKKNPSGEATSIEREIQGNPNLDDIPAIFRFVANAILYVNSNGADISYEDPRKFIEEVARANRMAGRKRAHAIDRTRQKYSGLRKVVLGRNIVPIENQPGTGGWRLKSRFRVRGHWRHYTSDRYSEEVRKKPKWIMPFYKGPDMQDMVGRKYQMGDTHGKPHC